ncbi:hypothetical protein BN134_411 [Cronobacter dublinensis 1210]|uniref:Uncharacterized protein n=1 Tax=Cronobacter dublinensis 1210 TaxID=1208656 RepID=A0ABP1W3M3_9ENTR|nr:hypothetical protein BN134_411 [Cronobacter dublinensis 1210]
MLPSASTLSIFSCRRALHQHTPAVSSVNPLFLRRHTLFAPD